MRKMLPTGGDIDLSDHLLLLPHTDRIKPQGDDKRINVEWSA
jgi:hypothetical protein